MADTLVISPHVLRSLACPVCHGRLTWDQGLAECLGCGQSYAPIDGVPELVPPSSKLAWDAYVETAENAALRERYATSGALARAIALVRPPLPYDLEGRWEGQRHFESALPRAESAIILDVGAGHAGDSHLQGLSSEVRRALVRTDMRPGPSVHFVSDAHHLPFTDDSVDGVILQGVVEHIPRPWDVAQEIFRVLKPGGVVFCEAPFVQWYHEDPKDYYRFTEDGLKEIFSDCEPIASGVAIGPVGACVGIVRELIPSLFAPPLVYWPLKWTFSWLMHPIVWFDWFYRRRPRARTIALAVYLVARKPVMQ